MQRIEKCQLSPPLSAKIFDKNQEYSSNKDTGTNHQSKSDRTLIELIEGELLDLELSDGNPLDNAKNTLENIGDILRRNPFN